MTVDDISSGIGAYAESEGGVDYIQFTEAVEIIDRIAGMALGLLIVVLALALPIIIMIEIFYISFPVIRGGVDGLYGRLYGKKSNEVGLILRDAHRAIKLSAESMGEKSAIGEYLKIKWKTIIIANVVMLVALQGGPIVVGFARKIILNIMKAFEGVM